MIDSFVRRLWTLYIYLILQKYTRKNACLTINEASLLKILPIILYFLKLLFARRHHLKIRHIYRTVKMILILKSF